MIRPPPGVFPTLGFALMVVGFLGFVIAGIWRAAAGTTCPGEIPAIALFLMLFGFVSRNPGLLRDDTDAVSAMRVVLFGLFCVFAILTVKAGWGAADLSSLTLSPGWSLLLGAVAGSKAAQSFSEPSKATDLTPPAPKP